MFMWCPSSSISVFSVADIHISSIAVQAYPSAGLVLHSHQPTPEFPPVRDFLSVSEDRSPVGAGPPDVILQSSILLCIVKRVWIVVG